LNDKAADFAGKLQDVAQKTGMPVTLNRVGSLMTSFFTEKAVFDFPSAMQADPVRYAQHYRQMLAEGIYLAPSQFEVAFISAAHTGKDLDTAVKTTEWSFKNILGN
jgi:glutamate-1-semialdehyde 2,1-aminomutase